jgi:hypothetical protein
MVLFYLTDVAIELFFAKNKVSEQVGLSKFLDKIKV